MDILGIPVAEYSRVLIFKERGLMERTIKENPHVKEIMGIDQKFFPNLFMAGIKTLDNAEQNQTANEKRL